MMIGWLLGVTVAFAAGADRSGLSREPGAIYLQDFLTPGQKALLKVVQPAPIYYQMDGKRLLGTLVVGADAEIVAVADHAYKVRTRAAHADVSGWVSPKALQSHNGADFVRVLKELQERQILVDDLIRQKKVALGMTAREVSLALGQPDRVDSAVDGNGRIQVFEYISYKRIPQISTVFDAFGRPYQTTTWIKVETGKTAVELVNNSVTSIQNSEGSPNLSSPVIITPPPILAF